MIARAEWLDRITRTPVADVAARLGIEVGRAPSASSCACPACGAERRHPGRHDRRGAVGIAHTKPLGWRCFVCDASGDSLDFVACKLHGRRFRELSSYERADVRAWLERDGFCSSTAPAPRSAEPVAPSYPPLAEVEALWSACGDVTHAAKVAAYLHRRRLDAGAIADLGLARALPAGLHLPTWARLGERSWLESGHHLIVPLFDARGVMRSVLARSIEVTPRLKSAAPRGHGRGGLLLADSIGRGMLEHGRAPRWWPAGKPFDVLIREGEIDFLQSACARQGKAATLGVVSGSWTRDAASRVPAGAHVTVGTDADAQGDRYAGTITETLQGKVAIERWRVAA